MSPEARADLDGVWDYIAERAGIDTAEAFFWKFYETFSSLASTPAAGVAMPDFASREVRKFRMGWQARPATSILEQVAKLKRSGLLSGNHSLTVTAQARCVDWDSPEPHP